MRVKVLHFSVKKDPEKKVPYQKRCSFFEEKNFKILRFKVCRSLMYFILSEIRRRSTFSLQKSCMDDHCLVDPLPIVWIVVEGQRMVCASMEACLYTIMDFSAKCVFGIIIIQAREAVESVTASNQNVFEIFQLVKK